MAYMAHRPVLVAGAAIVVIAGGLVAWWLLGSSSDSGFSPAAQDARTTPLTSERAAELTEDLHSGQESRVRDAVALSPDQPLDPNAAAALARIDLSFELPTFHDSGHGTATVVAHGSNGKWQVTLVRADGRWKISRAEPLS